MSDTATHIASDDSADPYGKRLDYIFHSRAVSRVADINVGCTEPMKLRGKPRKPGKGIAAGNMVSLSDHFSVELKLEVLPRRQPPLIALGEIDGGMEREEALGEEEEYLSSEVMDEIQALSRSYTRREEWEYTWRIGHFWASVGVLVVLHVGVWWGSEVHAGVAFLFTVLAWVVGVTGTMDGLIGFLFMGSGEFCVSSLGIWYMGLVLTLGWQN